jgi:hypothetical protein
MEIDREAEFLAFIESRLGSTTDDRQLRHA